MKKRETKLYLDPDIWEWLRAEADKSRCSVSEVVRRVVLAKMSAMKRGG